MMAKKSRKAFRKQQGAWTHNAAPAKAVSLCQAPWDMGASGAANRAGMVIEERGQTDPATGRVSNPNQVMGARRVDMLEVWHRRGVISTAGFNAAEKLRAAFEGTMRGPGWPDNDRVQASPKPDHAVAMQIDRISRYARLAAYVTREDWPLVEACVLDGKTPAAIRGYRGPGYRIGLTALHDALERTARAMDR